VSANFIIAASYTHGRHGTIQAQKMSSPWQNRLSRPAHGLRIFSYAYGKI
jgi:hypothetical protein